MIVFNKIPNRGTLRISSSKVVLPHRRCNTIKKITKSNKDFLQALGFKLK